MKFTLPILALLAFAVFAFGNIMFSTKSIEKIKNNNKEKLADAYFVFNGTSTTQYTDSTKWTMHSSDPGPSCPGNTIACLVRSATLNTRTKLVEDIQANGGTISSAATILDKKSAE